MEEVKNTEIKEEKEPKKKRTTKQKVFLGLEIAANVIFYIVIIALFLFAIFNINGGNGTENFPNIFGHGFLSVQSDSMYHGDNETPEEWKDYPIKDGFNTGDLIGADTFDESNTSNLHIGDVVVFVGNVNGSTALVTHRIVAIVNDHEIITQGDKAALELSTTYVNGQRITNEYITEGTARYEYMIANGMTNEEINTFNYKLSAAQAIEVKDVSLVRGVATSVTAGGGKVLDNIQKNYLFYFVFPVAILLLFEVFLVIRNIVILRGEKNKAELESTRENMIKDVEAEKERIRQELLAEMRAQGLVQDEVEESKDENIESDEDNSNNEDVAESNEEKEIDEAKEEAIENNDESNDDVEKDSTNDEIEEKTDESDDSEDSKKEE